MSISAEGELRAQHEKWAGARDRLGVTIPPPRVRRAPPLIVREQPVYTRPTIEKPLLALPVKVLGPVDVEQWPPQPHPVFYDEAAPSPSTTWQDVLREACIDHDVSWADVLGPRHFRRLVAVRDVAAFRMVVELGMSYAAVGRRLMRDHTTVIASLSRYVRAHPEAAAALKAQRDGLRRDRQALKEEAARLYLYGGKTIKQIQEMLPISFASIKTALKEWRDRH